MPDIILVDTDIIIDAGRQVADAINRLSAEEKAAGLAVSVVTYLELLVGCQNKSEQRNLERFLKRFEVINLDEPSSAHALDLLRTYRLSHGLLIADGLIAATAITRAMPLLTKNQNDYRFIKGLTLLAYP